MKHPLEGYAKKHHIQLQADPHEGIERDDEGVPLEDPGTRKKPIVKVGLWLTFVVFPAIGCLLFRFVVSYDEHMIYSDGWWLYGIAGGWMLGWMIFGLAICDESNYIGVDDWRAWHWEYGPGSKRKK